MATNQAFAKKLQAAIKAKIQELGIEADNDMAEYVLVLAGNKKDKAQMKKELQLFLGKNTGCFVDWLFAAFERIQKTLTELKQQEKSTKPKEEKHREVPAKYTLKDEKHSSRPSYEDKRQDTRQSDKSTKDDRKTSRWGKPLKAGDDRKKSDRYAKDERRPERSSKVEKKPRESPKDERREKRRDRSREDKHVKSRDDKHVKVKDESKTRERSKEKQRDKSKEKKRESPKEESKKRKHHANFEERTEQISESEKEPPAKLALKEIGKEKSPERVSKRPRIQPPHHALPDDSTISVHISTLTSKKRIQYSEGVRRLLNTEHSSHERDSNEEHRRERYSPHKHHDKHEKHRSVSPKEKKEDERSNDSTPAPLTNTWDGRITIDEESSDDDAEAQIDALLDGLDELIDTIPETSILSGSNISAHFLQQHQSPSPTQSTSTFEAPSQAATSTSVIVPQQIKKIPEKCRFWPGCDKLAQCAYHHPIEVCAVFPNCPFGDRCLNIHPLCKFNKKCKKPRCPFTHDLKGAATVVPYPHDIPAAIAQQQANPAPIMQTAVCPSPVVQTPPVIPCRFGGQCAATECKFWHPPPCRFGLLCKNAHCKYSHKKPNLKKYQWTNNNQQ